MTLRSVDLRKESVEAVLDRVERSLGARLMYAMQGDIPRVAVEGSMGHELPGVEGTHSEVTIAMEERIVGYPQEVWEKEVVGAGLWTPPFPIRLPDDPAKSTPPRFSGLPTLEYE